MASSYANPSLDNFWSNAGPGLLNLGIGLWSNRQANNEAASRLGTVQSNPLYSSNVNAATGALSTAANFDPNALAAQRFAAQQALVAPLQQKQVDDLTGALRARGMLGLGVYNPGIKGYTPDGKTQVNPELAALYAGQAAANNQSAYNAMNEGQTYANNLVQRAGMLTSNANTAQNMGLNAQRTQPSSAAGNAQLLSGAAGLLKNTGALTSLGGMLGNGVSWLGNKISNWWNPTTNGLTNLPLAPAPSFSFPDLGGGSDLNNDSFSFDF